MYKILLNTPFGFAMELINESVYQLDEPYEIYIDNKLHSCRQENTAAIFGLTPNTSYRIELKSSSINLCFTYQTEKSRYVADVREYGAKGDGCYDDTMAINAAIYTATAGSVVRFKKGVYMVSSVFLKSGVDIYLEDGAEIRQTTDRAQLAVIKGYQKNYDHTKAVNNATWEGNPLDCYASVIYGCEVYDVRIYGAGIINGNGDAGDFWHEPKVKKAAWRPRNLFLAHCSDITVAGITSRNSAAWNLHPYYSENLRFYCLNIESDPNSPNTDGLNPDSCSEVAIVGCRFHVGDDCIAIKSGKFYMSRYHYKPSQNIVVRNCLMEQGHGGVVIGSEISCGAKGIEVTQCLFRGTDRGLRVKTRR
ncbi:MAG: glycoside hydrolase family 28 protein, partial [Defluviitaleaceae bacterium]|nr:glycoside hydrolase family 28 protein [Defluviitaleaceae bacterium]